MESKKIKNPAYKGVWVHPEIDNPDYVEQKDVYKRGPMNYVGIEIWQVKAGTLFSDFILTDDISEAEKFAKERSVNKEEEEKAKTAFDGANKSDEEEPAAGDFEDDHDHDHVHEDL
jgi:calreticulin